jgi:hypothetical protein
MEKGSNDFLRFSALSNAGFETDGMQKTNQDAFISINHLGEFPVEARRIPDFPFSSQETE